MRNDRSFLHPHLGRNSLLRSLHSRFRSLLSPLIGVLECTNKNHGDEVLGGDSRGSVNGMQCAMHVIGIGRSSDPLGMLYSTFRQATHIDLI